VHVTHRNIFQFVSFSVLGHGGDQVDGGGRGALDEHRLSYEEKKISTVLGHVVLGRIKLLRKHAERILLSTRNAEPRMSFGSWRKHLRSCQNISNASERKTNLRISVFNKHRGYFGQPFICALLWESLDVISDSV
jgi:hypothetical protein